MKTKAKKIFKNIKCPICNKDNSFLVYKSDFKIEQLNKHTFLSRKTPKKVHYRMVKCKNCKLLYSNPILKDKYIGNLYKEAEVPLDRNLVNASEVYYHYLQEVLKKTGKKAEILDIGCGNGFLLKLLKDKGWKNVYGVEPSKNSVGSLPKGLSKQTIKIGLYDKSMFPKDKFDLICFFQVFDHLTDPNRFLKDCYFNLKKKGKIFALMHNTDSLSLKILGESSPIIDVQHIHLFNKENIKRIFENNGFKDVDVFTTYSRYTLGYWLKMGPFPSFVKKVAVKYSHSYILNLNIWFPAGNMAVIASKNG